MIFGYNGTHGAGYWYIPTAFMILVGFWAVSVIALIVLWTVWRKRQ